MTYILTGTQIDRARVYVLFCALSLEIKGLKRKGRSAYSIAKEEFNLKGSRESVLTQLREIMAAN